MHQLTDDPGWPRCPENAILMSWQQVGFPGLSLKATHLQDQLHVNEFLRKPIHILTAHQQNYG